MQSALKSNYCKNRQRVFDVLKSLLLVLEYFFERSLYFLGKIVVFVRTEYREYLFLEKTALAVIGWEHILGLTLQSWHCEDDEDETHKDEDDGDDDDNCENLIKGYDDEED